MRLLNIQQSSPLPTLGILTNVVELPHYEMIYIYHHLQSGQPVELRREENHIFDRSAIAVYFKGFKLGYISNRINGLISQKIDAGKAVTASIRNITKQKYMPLSGLELELKVM